MKIIEGNITAQFGIQKDPFMQNGWRQHNGIDIAAPVGTPIFAPVEAVVADVYEHYSGGLTLILADKGRTIRLGFCHLNSVKVKPGQQIKAGYMIAYSGNTGLGTGPHLHFSLKTDGKWKNGKYLGGQFKDPSQFTIVNPYFVAEIQN